MMNLNFGVTKEVLVALNGTKSVKKLEEFGGIQAIAGMLNTNLRTGLGLNERMSEYKQRSLTYDTNIRVWAKPKRYLSHVLTTLRDDVMIALMICALINLFFSVIIIDDDAHWYEPIGIYIAIFCVTVIVSAANWRKEKQFFYLNQVKEDGTSKVIRNGDTEQISSSQVQVGDVVRLDQGDVIPADCIFIEGFHLTIDETNLTGGDQFMHKNSQHPFMCAGSQVVDERRPLL